MTLLAAKSKAPKEWRLLRSARMRLLDIFLLSRINSAFFGN